MSTDRLMVANVLEQIAALLEFRGDNPFRVRAFRNAAKAVMGLSGSVPEALADGSLAKTPSIGPATLAIVQELLATGRCEVLEQIQKEIPAGLLELLAVPGLGAARIRVLHERLAIGSLAELEAAARDGRLAKLPGFGAKTAEKILKGIAFARGSRGQRLWFQALPEAEVLRSALAGLAGITRVEIAGELRRRSEVVGELSLAALSDAGTVRIREALARLPGIQDASAPETGLLRFRSAGGMAASVRLAPEQDFGTALVQATGSASHWDQLVARAESKGLVLEPVALRRGGKLIPTPDEATLYQSLGLAEVPPELREGREEIALAERRKLPRLIEPKELVGFLHCHTSYSDGTLSVTEMAAAVRDAGYAYIGITDHSRTAAYAGGLSVAELQQQWEEIAALNASRPGIRVLKGIESDILLDGRLDYDEETLDGLDFVIGSIHSRFTLGEAEMTARVLAALDDPHLTILGHPTGRLLLSRNPYAIDLEPVFAKAAANGVAIEINGDPHRLDLDWRMVGRAREQGVMISLGADAHGRSGIGYLEFAVAMARKAGLRAEDVLNTRSAEQFLGFARERRP